MRIPGSVLDRFMARVVPDASSSPSGCWRWTGAHSRKKRSADRPVLWVSGRVVHAARVALMLTSPRLFTDDLEASHLCDNPACVNPEHLQWESSAANRYARRVRQPDSFRRRTARA